MERYNLYGTLFLSFIGALIFAVLGWLPFLGLALALPAAYAAGWGVAYVDIPRLCHLCIGLASFGGYFAGSQFRFFYPSSFGTSLAVTALVSVLYIWGFRVGDREGIEQDQVSVPCG